MQIPILVEPLPNGQGYVARAGEPFAIRVEGPTISDATKTLE